MKNMYFVKAKIATFQYTLSNWYGGDTEEQAVKTAITSIAKFYEVEPHTIKIESIKLSGPYEQVLKDLMKG